MNGQDQTSREGIKPSSQIPGHWRILVADRAAFSVRTGKKLAGVSPGLLISNLRCRLRHLCTPEWSETRLDVTTRVQTASSQSGKCSKPDSPARVREKDLSRNGLTGDRMNVLLPRVIGMVLDKWKVIYVITPKLMGTSMLWMMAELQNQDPARYVAHCRAPEVTRALAVHDPAIWQHWFKQLHLLPADVIEQVTSEDGWFRLGWTRHPVNRLWSAWQSKLLLREPHFVELYGTAQWFPRTPKKLPKGAATLGAIVEDFESFVAALAQDPQLLTADAHWAPQSYLLRPDVFPYSEIGRIESTAVTLGRLECHLQAQGWRGTLDLKWLNATLVPREVIRDPTLLQLIEKIYTDDMIAFGYEPANVGHPPSADASAVAVQALAELVERHERIGDLHRMLAPG